MGTSYDGSERERRALDVYIKLARGYDAVVRELADRLEERDGLALIQLGILEALLHLGPLERPRLESKLLVPPENLTATLDHLERGELVSRRRDPEDRRRVEVHLTDDGRELVRDVFPRHAADVADLLSALDPEEQAELGRLCERLGRSAGGGTRAEDDAD